MSEKRILIASLLKPVNDTRMYEKLALSLSKLPDTKVFICGFAGTPPAHAPANISFHPLFRFKRLSPGRFTAQLNFLRLLYTLKPDLVIACTHELLWASWIYCRKYKAKLVYDVQENYTLNLRSQHNYPVPVKRLLAHTIGKIEQFVAPHVQHFILAEKCYATELNFTNQKYTVLENKYKKPSGYTSPVTPVRLANAPLRLLYSGTIAIEYGILEAISLADKLYTLAPDTSLLIIGYCSNSSTWQRVLQSIANKPYIRVIGGEQLVPHSQIIEAMQQANVGLLPYLPNPSTAGCIPTKLFEYMAHGLPILISQNPIWQGIVQEHQAGMSVHFTSINAAEILDQLRRSEFYTDGIPNDIFWETEEAQLLALTEALLA